MPRYKLTIAYDGTDFCGWQKQEPPADTNIAVAKTLPPEESFAAETEHASEPDSVDRIHLRTVQGVIERAVREVVREPVNTLGASRTDAGVHARGQVAAFTCSDSAWPVERGTTPLLRAINSRLPDDVLVTAAEPVPESFNPISDCTSKGYSYTLHVSPHRSIWDRRFVHHIWTEVDIPRMNEAAAHLIGEHDFAAFAAAGHGRLSTIRTIFTCRASEASAPRPDEPDPAPGSFSPRRIRIEVSGNGFLWNMVRIVAGTLVEVGRNKLSPDDVVNAIESKDRRNAGPTLPPTGLCLEWVRYRS